MIQQKDYQRRYLRAPYKQDILYVDENFVFKGKTLNISEGGLLLDEVGHFPEGGGIPFMVKLPQFPLFKNFDLDKLRQYNLDTLRSQIIRFTASLVRKIGQDSQVDGVFISQIGLNIEKISDIDQAKVANYVDVFASNLIYLQVLIDNLNSDINNLEKVRIISEHLGYCGTDKIAYLRKLVENDYKNLQWL